MDEARQVLARLERIDALERRLLDEVRALGPEADAWARRERDPAASQAVARLLERIREP